MWSYQPSLYIGERILVLWILSVNSDHVIFETICYHVFVYTLALVSCAFVSIESNERKLIVIFHKQNDVVLSRATTVTYLWSNLPHSLDCRLSNVHEHSCRGASVVVAIVRRVVSQWPSAALDNIRDALYQSLCHAIRFDISPTLMHDAQTLLEALQSPVFDQHTSSRDQNKDAEKIS